MTRPAMDLIYFVVLVGVLIFVHELGHFAWAKFFGVKVLRFSLGFGPRIVGFHRGETEYRVGAIPLGGYVKMLGESPGDVVQPGEETKAFQWQPLWKRFLIVVAGPAMNLVFPVALFFVVYLGDAQMPPPVVGTVFPDRPADGRLLPGDRVVSIDGEQVDTFYELSQIVAEHPGQPLDFVIERRGKQVEETITPVLTRQKRELQWVEEVGRIGIMPHHRLAVVGVTSPSSPAAAAGLETFDVVIAADGEPVERWLDLEQVLDGNRGASVPLTYLRPHRVPDALGGLAEMDVFDPHVATLTPEPGSGSALLRSGLEHANAYVAHVTAGTPEHRLGLLPGDRLITLDGRPVRLWTTFLEDLKASGGRPHELTWKRGDRQMRGTLRLEHEHGVTEYGRRYDRHVVGMGNWSPLRVEPDVRNPAPIAYATTRALESSAEMVEVTILSVIQLLQGKLSVKTIGGPITIFDVAGTAAREGTGNYLTLMAFISINLGLINLLPIPLLDGGHVLFFLVEGVLRRRVSPKVRQYASFVGLLVLIVLMVLAFKNDIERQWPGVIDEVSSEVEGG